MVSSAELDTDTFNELDIDIAKLCEMNIAKLTFPIRLVVCRLMDTNTSEA